MSAGALAMGPSFWEQALAASPATPGPGPYGPLQPPDANGIMLPAGFQSRVIARGNVPVVGSDGSSYVWHIFSDGEATYATDGGGFILVSNSEVPGGQGGASAIRFAADGTIRRAYRILAGTSTNCSGGGTPWGTWLSCEEVDDGRVWECDPTGQNPAVVRPAMGVFSHEAVAVDPQGKRLYLTEDVGDGGFYRFTPASYPTGGRADLSAGVLEIARAPGEPGATTDGGKVTWVRVPDPSAATTPTRRQVQATRFQRGEGIWFDSGIVYVATTSDDRIYAYDTATEMIELLYDGEALASAGMEVPLKDVDNVTVSRQSGDLYVCEDDGSEDPLDIGIITPDREVARFLKLTGSQHGVAGTEAMSEVTGVIFDPSGTRMYFASQRAFGLGVVYEVTGRFRLERQGQPTVPKLSLDVQAPDSMAISAFRRRGLPVTATTNRTAQLRFVLRSADGTTLARTSRGGPEGGGSLRVDLEPTGAGRRYLADRRRVRATLTVTATGAAGAKRVVREAVLLRGRGSGPRGGGSPRQHIGQRRSGRRRQRYRR